MTSEEIAQTLDERRRKIAEETGEKECQACGAWFAPTHSSQIYCEDCRKDKNIIRKMQRRMDTSIRVHGTGQPIEMQTIICKECGKEFQFPADRRAEFCSAHCRIKYRREHATCANCGKNLYALGIIINENNKKEETWFCSDKCKEEHEWKVARAQGFVSACEYCGKEFINRRGGRFCCRECSMAWQKESGKKQARYRCTCERCGKAFLSSTNQRFCSRNCYRETMADEKVQRDASKKSDVKPKKSVVKDPAYEAKLLAARKKRQAEKVAKMEQEEQNRQAYIAANGLCGICKTSYKNCERMRSDFQLIPAGAVCQDGRIMECPKFK